MKIKKLLCLLLTLAMLLPTLLMGTVLETVAEEVSATPVSYVTSGLVALYSGTQNTRAGHDTASTVWEDLISGYDVTLKTNDKNYFTEEGFHLNSQINNFPAEIKDVVNGNSFTVELLVSDMTSLGSAYNTILNSYNDNFALFRRNSEDVLEFKYAANAQDQRPKISDCLETLQGDVLITITYKVGGDCTIYYNGVEQSCTAAPSAMGADTMFFGHDQDTRNYDITYRSIRFYNRDLSAAEVKRNAVVDGYGDVMDLYVSDGLVSLYSGIQSGADEAVWEDLAGDNDLSVAVSSKSYFNGAGLYVNGVQHLLPQTIVNLVNSNAFTVELSFDEFVSIGGSFNTFLNSKNDNFALFRRNSNDVLEFKFAANQGSERPTAPNGLDLIDRGTVSVTYEVGGKCRIYVDGVLMSEAASPKAMGADNLFIGHTEDSKKFETTYRSIRFYDRVLTAEEIAANAASDGVLQPVSIGGDVEITRDYITVAQPRTNVVGDLSVTREINSMAELTAMMAQKDLPAAAIYTVNDKAAVVDSEGNVIAALDEVLEATEYKILPILVPTSAAAVDAIAAFVKGTRFTDICILSKDASLVNTARTKMTSVRGAVDFTEAYKDTEALTKEECLNIRRTVKANAASVAVLPAHVATQEMVQYLYDNQVNVWVKAADDLDETAAYHAILSGGVGVITDDTQTVIDLACALPENTMTRMPLNVGHRGIPSKAPENTVEGSVYAYEHGADCIELDVYLTTDGEIVVMHDGNTGRTCDKDLSVEGSTWAQLSELYVNKGYENNETYKNCRIPRLKDYLEAFKDTDCRLFIEIKSGKTQIVKKIKEQIDEYDMYGQCSVITFNTGIMEAMRRDYPEMSVGALCSGYLDEIDSDGDMKSVMNFIGKTNATLNPSYSGYSENAVRAALIRGIGVFPWTFRGDQGAYQNHFIWGYSGLTGDNADVLTRFVKSVQMADTDILVGEEVELSLLVTYYSHKQSTKDADVILLKGADAVTLSGSKLTINQEDTEVVAILGHTYRLNATSVTVYTQPIVLAEGADDPIEEDSSEESTDTGSVEEPTDTDPSELPTDTEPDESGSAVQPVETDSATVTDESREDTDTSSVTEGESTNAVGSEANTTAEENGGCSSAISYTCLLILLTMSMACIVLKSKKRKADEHA